MRAERIISYYGSKYRLARHYPPPREEVLIEPFAGSAGYALHYPEKKVKLFDLNEKVCSVWDYVIRADPDEIRGLPLLEGADLVEDLPISIEAKLLIGWWVNNATTGPRRRLSKWSLINFDKGHPSTWTPRRREMVAQTSERVKHWTIEQKSYEDIDNRKASWFVDPPYQGRAGRLYEHSEIDFSSLALWCRKREGQVLVCENSDSLQWLPFQPFREMCGAKTTKTGKKQKTFEVLWSNDKPLSLPQQLSLF